jgi:hypothetical protein
VSLWNWLTRRRDDRGWPAYIINGRIRTSTVGLIVAFFVISWLHNTYQPPPPPAAPEPAQVVPPGFMPDPEYTWVPRTNVQERPKTTTTTTTESTEEPTPTDSTTPTTSPTPTGTAPVTVVDPDGPGPLPPTTLSPSATPGPATIPSTPTTIPTTPALTIPGLPPIPLPAPR